LSRAATTLAVGRAAPAPDGPDFRRTPLVSCAFPASVGLSAGLPRMHAELHVAEGGEGHRIRLAVHIQDVPIADYLRLRKQVEVCS